MNPMVCTSHPAYAEAAQNGWFNTDATGRPYQYRYSTADQFQVSQVDFTSAGGRDFFGRLLREAVDDGFDGWMEDFGEYTPADARSSDGTPGPAMHNLYPTLYHRDGDRADRRRRPADRQLRPLRASPARRRTRGSCGAATRRPTGASTAWPPR